MWSVFFIYHWRCCYTLPSFHMLLWRPFLLPWLIWFSCIGFASASCSSCRYCGFAARVGGLLLLWWRRLYNDDDFVVGLLLSLLFFMSFFFLLFLPKATKQATFFFFMPNKLPKATQAGEARKHPPLRRDKNKKSDWQYVNWCKIVCKFLSLDCDCGYESNARARRLMEPRLRAQ